MTGTMEIRPCGGDCLSRKSWVCQPPIPRTPELISCTARKRQNIGNGLSQATIGWHVWSRNGWNGEKEDMNSDQKTRS